MKSRIHKITLEVIIGNIRDVIDDSQALLRITRATEVNFLWNGTPVTVHYEDDQQELVNKYFADQGIL